LSFAGDPSTGIFSSGAGTLNIATGGTSRLNVDPSGNVGTGTTAPHSRLDVVDGATQVRFGATTADEGGYLISVAPSQAVISGGAKWDGFNWVAKSTAASLIDNRAGDISFYTKNGLTPGSTFSPTEIMRVTGYGNVGIGTSSPQYKL